MKSNSEILLLSHITFISFNYTGVDNVEIDLENKKVLVTTSLTNDTVLNAIKKTGRDVSFIGQA